MRRGKGWLAMTPLASLERAHPTLRKRHQARILKEAIAFCNHGLLEESENAHLLHVRGLLAARNGQAEFAFQCLSRAVALDSGNPRYLTDLGDLLIQTGRHAEALTAYGRAKMLTPEDPSLHRRLGIALFRQGRLSESTDAHEEALRLDPGDARAHRELGEVLEARCFLPRAIAYFRRAVELDPDDAEGYLVLGRAWLSCAESDRAIDAFQQGLQRQPNRVDLRVALGLALLRHGSLEEAIRAFRTALATDPRDLDACWHLVSALELLKGRDEAVDAWLRLGAALENKDRFQDAAAAYREALNRRPNCLRALIGLGSAHLQLAKPREALKWFEGALVVAPDHALAHQGRGWSHAMIGDVASDWDDISWFDHHGPRPRFEQPIWDGSRLEGRTILLWSHAGLGDVIQLIRFAPLVKERGLRIVIECARTLASLVDDMKCVDCVITQGSPLPSFDVQAQLTALPQILQIGWGTIPNQVPYLSVRQSLIETWRDRLASLRDRRIGLAWAGAPYGRNARLRFMPLASFSKLADLPNVRFVSLQLGPQAAELLAPSPGLAVARCLDESCTVADTAALISNLDLVITVDTMIAHLAGALARRVWTMLPYEVDWRWRLDSETTPWYPTMRLFRQTRTKNWSDVLTSIRETLETSL
jgi:tetratricopeptide (TPR) repeat protein